MRLSISPNVSYPTLLHFTRARKGRGNFRSGRLSVKRKQRKERQGNQQKHESRGVTKLVAPLCHFFLVGELESPTAVVKYLMDDNPLRFSNIPGYPRGVADSHSPLVRYIPASPVRLLRTYSGQPHSQPLYS